jgi:hypothetical protein
MLPDSASAPGCTAQIHRAAYPHLAPQGSPSGPVVAGGTAGQDAYHAGRDLLAGDGARTQL